MTSKKSLHDASDFLNIPKIISYGAPLNLIITARSYGKTYGLLKAAVKDYLRDRSQMVFVRRYKAEIKSLGNRIMDAISSNGEFPGYVFKNDSSQIYIAKKPTKDDKPKWEVLGYVIALNQQANYKGVEFPRVKKIIFDEFVRLLKKPPGYLPNEISEFLDLFKTISRDREGVYAYLLGNACDLTCPYLGFAHIYREPPDGISWHNGKNILCVYPKDMQFADRERETTVGRLVAGTEYEGVMIDNDFANGGDAFISKKPPRATYRYGFAFAGELFGVWFDATEGLFYINGKTLDTAENETFVLQVKDMAPNTVLVQKSSPLLSHIKGLYGLGLVRFDTAKRRESYIRMLGLLGVR